MLQQGRPALPRRKADESRRVARKGSRPCREGGYQYFFSLPRFWRGDVYKRQIFWQPLNKVASTSKRRAGRTTTGFVHCPSRWERTPSFTVSRTVPTAFLAGIQMWPLRRSVPAKPKRLRRRKRRAAMQKLQDLQKLQMLHRLGRVPSTRWAFRDEGVNDKAA